MKIAKALLLVKLSLSASYIVLLSGDVSTNPGPTKFSTTKVCAVCLKEITKKQPRLDCISCKQGIHLKCLGDDFETPGLCRLCCTPDSSVNESCDEGELYLFGRLHDISKSRGIKLFIKTFRVLEPIRLFTSLNA